MLKINSSLHCGGSGHRSGLFAVKHGFLTDFLTAPLLQKMRKALSFSDHLLMKMVRTKRKREKYETPDIATIQLETEVSMLTGSVVTVTDVPITLQEEGVSFEEYQNGKDPFDSEFEDLDF